MVNHKDFPAPCLSQTTATMLGYETVSDPKETLHEAIEEVQKRIQKGERAAWVRLQAAGRTRAYAVVVRPAPAAEKS